MQFKAKSSPRTTPTAQKSYTQATSKSTKLARHLEHSGRFDLDSILGDSPGSSFRLSTGSSVLSYQRGSSDRDDEDEEVDPGMQEFHTGDDETGHNDFNAALSSRTFYGNNSASNGNSSVQSSIFENGHMNESNIASSHPDPPPRGIKRSRGGALLPNNARSVIKSSSVMERDSTIPKIVAGIASTTNMAPLEEPDDLILETEELVAAAYGASTSEGGMAQGATNTLPDISHQLCKLWDRYRDTHRYKQNDSVFSIGPKETKENEIEESLNSLRKATFVSTLLLPLHHPPTAKGKQALALSRPGRSVSSASFNIPGVPCNATAIPKVLADWLETYHNPWEASLHEVQYKHPSPPAHYNFWDIILVLVLRGKVRDALEILRNSTFDCADTAPKDGQAEGYTEMQLRNIQRVVNQAIGVLARCPATVDDDWHVTGNEWRILRRLAEQSLNDLTSFAEGNDHDLNSSDSSLESPRSLSNSTSLTHSQRTRIAESRVPWSIYTSLRSLYSILLGRDAEIVASAQDWVEATIGQTIWWNGEEPATVSVGSLAKTRRSLKAFKSGSQRFVDLEPEAAYLEQISRAFERATQSAADDEFEINSNSPVEVGLASVFEGNVEGVLGLLRVWSLPVACAMAEIATLGGWFSSASAAPAATMEGFDENDLMVLSSYCEPKNLIRRDTIMVDYAIQAFEKKYLRREGSQKGREGWELSIALLLRLGDDKLSRDQLDALLKRIPVDDIARADMVLNICQDYGVETTGQEIAKKFAEDSISCGEIGTALIYYARARCQGELKHNFDSLLTHCLVESASLPLSSSLDPVLQTLISNPTKRLTALAKVDKEAARSLHRHLMGYAALRTFYESRDEATASMNKQTSNTQTMAEQRTAAAKVLFAVIHSAADNICGGLYDENREGVVKVHSLLALLGESMVFVNSRTESPLTLEQCMFLTKVIEDLQATTSHIFDECQTVLGKTLAAYHSEISTASSQHSARTRSSMTSSDSFSLIGSSILNSQSSDASNQKVSPKTPQQEIKRGWDWRAGVTKDAEGKDVLRILRLGLAKDIAAHWIRSEGA